MVEVKILEMGEFSLNDLPPDTEKLIADNSELRSDNETLILFMMVFVIGGIGFCLSQLENIHKLTRGLEPSR